MNILYEEGNTNIFRDKRGKIVNITPDLKIKDILYITGVTGAIRGNHHHKTDFHYCYVTQGEIQYEWESADGKGSVKLKAGDMVFSPAGEKHRFIFLSDGAFISLAKNERSTENYEGDTVREEF